MERRFETHNLAFRVVASVNGTDKWAFTGGVFYILAIYEIGCAHNEPSEP